MIYNIQNVDWLEQDASDLATQKQKVYECVEQIKLLINDIKSNWENEAGADLQSIITELEKFDHILLSAINPVVSKYVETMNILVAESRSNQNRSL